MTNTKQLTSAVALLAIIAVLDNFIFIELEPGFESMVLIEPYGASSAPEAMQANDSPSPQNEVQDFWIDQYKVSGADFAKFLDSTGYEPFTVPSNILQAHTSRTGGFTAILASDDWNGHSNTSSLSMPHTLAGQDDLEVSFKDALTYCNWLDKDLPTAKQFEHIARQDHHKKASGLIEFRCVKNI